MLQRDTIAAVSTPSGEGGIGVVRISGPEALEVGLRVFGPTGVKTGFRPEPRRVYFGDISAPGDLVVDKGLFFYLKGRGSFTGEDTVELHCHGGTLVVKKVLEAALAAGARPAEPGEFTKRAFLNGKLDLAQAEAVIDVIRAETDMALASARGRLEGIFSRQVNTIKDVLFGLVTRLEAELDFPEEDEVAEGLTDTFILEKLGCAEEMIKSLLATYEEGVALREGVRTVILGRPNVGKSSLLNQLLKEERAIVTPLPGTTRDVIEEVVNIRGLPVRLMDTAGLRETTDHVESIGVEKARERVESAGLVLFVVDSTSTDLSEDKMFLECADYKKTILVANKADLAGEVDKSRLEEEFEGYRIALISALDGTGTEELKDAIYEEAVGHGHGTGSSGAMPPGGLVVSARHRNSLVKALDGLARVRDAFSCGLGREFVATDLRWSLDRLGEITGETTTEDILERIFSDFCIGK